MNTAGVTFHEKLARRVKEIGLNKARASREVGLPESTISSYISNAKSLPRIDIAAKIAVAIDVPLSWLADDRQGYPPPSVSITAFTTEALVDELGRRMMSLATAALLKIIQAENTPWLDIGEATVTADPDKVPKRVRDAMELHQQINALVRELDRYDPHGQVGSDIPAELAKWVQPDFDLSLSDIQRRAANLEDDYGYKAAVKLGGMLIAPPHWRPPWFAEQLKTIREEVAAEIKADRAARERRDAERARLGLAKRPKGNTSRL